MPLSTTFIVIFMMSSPSTPDMSIEKNVKYFKNLTPIVYKDNAIKNKKHIYIKAPTKIIKINKNSN